ncbi:AAA-like domain-containing protein [Gloeothece verrucosa]|uniref:vWA-MoxR associated protein N-terminal HTH domain-containing protein n=1 Tax=Gloeothece verrucosa (strain PCC 7822) TaxID=497965 RepID=E0UFK5_GLOV7|nr:AAA-like domain-containing protein [Gloeothece verrucosa]ADN16699.1 conserved hypothetical protein [Gloeothece verrucosa PCC 7822]
MNDKSAFSWEQAKQVAEKVLFENFQEYLKDVEMQVLQGAWQGFTYEKMGEIYHLSVNYLRGDIGPKLWQKLSIALGEDVNKSNFKGAMERAWAKQQTRLSNPNTTVKLPTVSSVTDLSFPEGSVSLNSPFYLERDFVEELCYQTVIKPGSLIRIKAPKLMGKTSLLTRIIAYSQSHNYQTVYLNLSSVERSILTNLDKFLRWLCLMVSRQLKIENQLNNYWDTDILGSNDNCTVYFEEYLLTTINCPLVLGLDEVERIFTYIDVVEDFFGMLRSWHEKGKISPIWKQLRLVMAHSTECYIPLDMNQSPFNAGVPIELKEFEQKQVKKLADLYALNWHESQVEKLMKMVGGHPYLGQLAMYQVKANNINLEQLLQQASTESGIYNNHLRRQLEILKKNSELAEAFKRVVNSSEPVELESIQIYKLHSIGLVQRLDNMVIPRCNLYREYFRRVL